MPPPALIRLGPSLLAFALLWLPARAQDGCVAALADEWKTLAPLAERAGSQAERASATQKLADLLERALACDARGAEAGFELTLEKLGGALHDLGQPEPARKAYQRALELVLRVPEGRATEIDRCRNAVGVMLQEQGRLQEALPLFEEVLESREQRLKPDATLLLQARINVATCLKQLGELKRAREIEEAVVAATAQRPDGDVTALTARMNYAATLDMLGESRRAAEADAELIARLEKAGPAHASDLNMVLENRGSALLWIGELEASRDALERALEWKEAHLPPGHPWIARNRLNLGVTLYELDDLPRARALFEQALATLEPLAPAQHPDLQRLRANLAMVQFAAGDLDGARAGMERVLRIWEQHLAADDPERLRAQGCLAAVLQQQRHFDEAIALQRATLAAQQAALGENSRDVLRARSNLCVTLADAGQIDEALTLELETLARLEREWPNDHASIATARSDVAGMLARLGRFDEALPRLRRALEERGAVERSERTTLMRILGCELGQGRATESPELLQRLARATEADLEFLALLPERERARALDFLGEPLGWLCLDARARPRGGVEATLAFRLAADARLLLAQPALARALCSDPALAPLFARVRELRGRTGGLVAALGAAAGAPPADALAGAASELEQVEAALQAALSASRRAPARVDPLALARRLGPGVRAVELETCIPPSRPDREWPPARVVALVLAPSGSAQAVDLGPAAELEQAIQRWRTSIGAPLHEARAASGSAPAQERDAARELAERALLPILAACGEAREIVLCANDLFELVPLDTLPLEDALAGERWTIRLVDSFGAPVREAQGGEAGALLALGDANFDAGPAAPEPDGARRDLARAAAPGRAGNWSPLAGTRVELEALRGLYRQAFSGEPAELAGAAATKAALFERAPSARWLHVATHGYFAPESVRAAGESQSGAARWPRMSVEETVFGLAPSALCGLVLAGANRGPDPDGRVDGIATAEELAALDLSHCELAVLSACETDVGLARAGRSLHTLQSALHAAGARATLTSLWRVSDTATRELMQRFYRALWLEKKDAARALWEAKLALRAQRLPTRDWAGWVLSERAR